MSSEKESKVVVVVRVYPKEILEKFDDLIRSIEQKLPKERYTITKWEPVDIAFGYRALELYIVMPEMIEGGTEELEEILKSVEGVDNIDVVYVSRISF